MRGMLKIWSSLGPVEIFTTHFAICVHLSFGGWVFDVAGVETDTLVMP
jgi:hypothetical protein